MRKQCLNRLTAHIFINTSPTIKIPPTHLSHNPEINSQQTMVNDAYFIPKTKTKRRKLSFRLKAKLVPVAHLLFLFPLFVGVFSKPFEN